MHKEEILYTGPINLNLQPPLGASARLAAPLAAGGSRGARAGGLAVLGARVGSAARERCVALRGRYSRGIARGDSARVQLRDVGGRRAGSTVMQDQCTIRIG